MSPKTSCCWINQMYTTSCCEKIGITMFTAPSNCASPPITCHVHSLMAVLAFPLSVLKFGICFLLPVISWSLLAKMPLLRVFAFHRPWTFPVSMGRPATWRAGWLVVFPIRQYSLSAFEIHTVPFLNWGCVHCILKNLFAMNSFHLIYEIGCWEDIFTKDCSIHLSALNKWHCSVACFLFRAR